MRVWIILAGTVRLACAAGHPSLTSTFTRGDVILIPARCTDLRAEPADDCRCIQATIPIG